MRYGYGQAEVSMVNRVYNAVYGHSRLNEGEFAYATPGISHLAAVIWFEADIKTDWGGETDAVLDQYGCLKNAWEDIQSHPDAIGGQVRQLKYDRAEAIALEFENRLYLAMVTVQTLISCEGLGAGDMINQDGAIDRIYEEVLKDRREINSRVLQHLA